MQDRSSRGSRDHSALRLLKIHLAKQCYPLVILLPPLPQPPSMQSLMVPMQLHPLVIILLIWSLLGHRACAGLFSSLLRLLRSTMKNHRNLPLTHSPFPLGISSTSCRRIGLKHMASWQCKGYRMSLSCMSFLTLMLRVIVTYPPTPAQSTRQ
jgi:hypothetical protein